MSPGQWPEVNSVSGSHFRMLPASSGIFQSLVPACPAPLPLVHAIYLPGLRHSVIHKNVVAFPINHLPLNELFANQAGQNDN